MYQNSKENVLSQWGLRQTYSFILGQALVVVTLALILLVVTRNAAVFISCILGGLAYIVPCALFALRFFGKVSEREPRKILNSFYLQELIKMVLSIFLLLLVLYFMANMSLFAVFLGFMGAYGGLWLGPLLGRKTKKAV